MKLTEWYQCIKCGERFRGYVGPSECAFCGGLYLKWLTYSGQR